MFSRLNNILKTIETFLTESRDEIGHSDEELNQDRINLRQFLDSWAKAQYGVRSAITLFRNLFQEKYILDGLIICLEKYRYFVSQDARYYALFRKIHELANVELIDLPEDIEVFRQQETKHFSSYYEIPQDSEGGGPRKARASSCESIHRRLSTPDFIKRSYGHVRVPTGKVFEPVTSAHRSRARTMERIKLSKTERLVIKLIDDKKDREFSLLSIDPGKQAALNLSKNEFERLLYLWPNPMAIPEERRIDLNNILLNHADVWQHHDIYYQLVRQIASCYGNYDLPKNRTHFQHANVAGTMLLKLESSQGIHRLPDSKIHFKSPFGKK